MTKTCARCGRIMEPRKKWARNWDSVKYCSEKCRRLKASSEFESEILELLRKRGSGKTICPSEVLPPAEKSDKSRMEEVRQAARRLVAQGRILMTQNGQVVDPSTAKGPIRLKLV
jgi:hypothetical protein